MRTQAAVAALFMALGSPLCVFAQDESARDETSVTLRSAVKSSVLLSRSPETVSGAGRNDASGFWRFRLEPTFRLEHAGLFECAFEQRLRVASSAIPGTTLLTSSSNVRAPYRIRQLDWQITSNMRSEWRGEIDRAAWRAQAGRADLTIGRQAIGWGRGALFGAVDLFAPFSPLEIDREWRRGVDAARADLRISDRMSLDSVAAFGDSIRESAFVSRLRGYSQRADVELLGGYRARDLFSGITSSAPIGALELHGELAVFRTSATEGSVVFGDQRTILKGVAGGSYRVPLANGVLVFAEYHYSGFGAASTAALAPTLQDQAFQARYLRGDTQILGRHAFAALASYEFSPEWTTSNDWIQSATDGSGVVFPAMTWTLSDRWSVLMSGYVPYGRSPVQGVIQTEFGSAPLAAFLQVRTYW